MPDSDPHSLSPARDRLTVAAMNTYNASVPYNAWLGAEVLSADELGVKVRIPWRVEFASAPGMTHGGVLAGIIDMTACMVLMTARGGVGPTVDLRVDFHRSTVNGTLYAIGRLLRSGATISTVEVHVQDSAERLIASGRCVYLSQSRKRPVESEPAVEADP